jgi:hypothetical protein
LATIAVVAFLFGSHWTLASGSWSLDFDLNWVAAHRLIAGQSLYVPAQAQRTGLALVGRDFLSLNRDPFNTYISTPFVALAHVPFAPFDHQTATQAFRVAGIVEMVVALGVTARSLPQSRRLVPFLLGIGALFWGFPLVMSVADGQINGLVMLGLAFGMWGASRKRWEVAGVGLGFAATLKVTPVLLIVYLVARGNRRVLRSAILTVVSCLGAAAAVGRPVDLWVWARDVAPQVSKGTVDVYNQSIVGTLSRMTTAGNDLGAHVGPGPWYIVGYVLCISGLLALWRWRRNRPLDLLELGILVLLVLLAGPLSWDHYFTWVAIPLVLMFGSSAWTQSSTIEKTALGLGLLGALNLMSARVPLPTPDAVATNWWLRITSAPYTASVTILIVIAICLLARTPDYRDAWMPPPQVHDEQRQSHENEPSLADTTAP